MYSPFQFIKRLVELHRQRIMYNNISYDLILKKHDKGHRETESRENEKQNLKSSCRAIE